MCLDKPIVLFIRIVERMRKHMVLKHIAMSLHWHNALRVNTVMLLRTHRVLVIDKHKLLCNDSAVFLHSLSVVRIAVGMSLHNQFGSVQQHRRVSAHAHCPGHQHGAVSSRAHFICC